MLYADLDTLIFSPFLDYRNSFPLCSCRELLWWMYLNSLFLYISLLRYKRTLSSWSSLRLHFQYHGQVCHRAMMVCFLRFSILCTRIDALSFYFFVHIRLWCVCLFFIFLFFILSDKRLRSFLLFCHIETFAIPEPSLL